MTSSHLTLACRAAACKCPAGADAPLAAPLAEGMTPAAPSLTSVAPLVVDGLDVVLHHDRQRHPALREVSFAVAAGETVAVIGESSCGKSELLLAILGQLPETARMSGGIHIAGRSTTRGGGGGVLRDRVGVVFQDTALSLDPTMRVGRQLSGRARRHTDIPRLLARAGLDPAETDLLAFPHQIALARRRQVMLAMALARAPALLLLEEPTGSLDITAQADMLRCIAAIRAERATGILLLTESFSVAAAVAERALVLHAGRIVESGGMADLLSRPAHPYTEALLAARCGLTADRTRRRPGSAQDGMAAASAVEANAGCSFRGPCPAGSNRCSQQPVLASAGRHGGQVACWNVNSPARHVALPARWAALPASSAAPVLRLDGVSRWFVSGNRPFTRRVTALEDITLHVGDRECLAIVGSAASGKTTLLRIAAGLLPPSAGRRGYAGTAMPQMIFRDPHASLTPWLRVDQIVGERLRRRALSSAERAARVEEALALAQLPPDIAHAKPRDLSSGQAQRVAIARALIVPPPLLLCDEPLALLDDTVAAGLLNLLCALRRGMTMAVLFATDDIAAARYIADRIVVLDHGRIAEIGAAEATVATPTSAATMALIAAAADPAPLAASVP